MVTTFVINCRRWDSNPQGVNHTNLNRARLPIPPLRHLHIYNIERKVKIKSKYIYSLFTIYYSLIIIPQFKLKTKF